MGDGPNGLIVSQARYQSAIDNLGLTEKFDIEGIPIESARRATFLIDKSGAIINEQVGDAAVDPSKTVEACERHKLKN